MRQRWILITVLLFLVLWQAGCAVLEREAAMPTAKPSQEAASSVLVQLGRCCGDVGSRESFLLGGCCASELVIYPDGQIILMEGEYGAYNFVEAELTKDEMCNLLSQIEASGFLQITGTGQLMERDSIYRFDEAAQYSEGAGGYFIQVNGDPPKAVFIYSRYAEYLVPEVRSVYDLLSRYRPQGVKPYVPEGLLLWASAGGTTGAEVSPMEWPTHLPSLAELLEGRSEGDVVIEGELASAIWELFNGTLSEREFIDGGKQYTVIARPLLPHEHDEVQCSCMDSPAPLDAPLPCDK